MRGSIQRKGKSYYIVVRVYDSETGKRKQKWINAGTAKRGAEVKLAEIMGDVHKGAYRDIKKATLGEFSKLWIESYAKANTKPSTLRSYKDIIKNHMVPVFGDYLLTDITTAMLQRYVADKLEVVKPKTVINELVPLKKMFKHAVTWGYLKVNCAGYVEKPRVEKEEMEILTPEEINKFMDHVRPKYRVFFLTAILTGMRRGEILGLQWGDIDWSNNQVHVRRSLWQKKFVTPKSRTSVRKIDMSPTLTFELKKHKMASPPSDSDLIFCNAEGDPPSPDSIVRRQFLPALRRAKIRRIRFHDLRHTNVALRIEQGQNIKYIQHQLGHASIQTTLDRYGHLIKDVNTEQAKKLDSILGFVEHSGSSSDSVRRMLEKGGFDKEKGLSDEAEVLEIFGSGGRI